MPPILFIYFLCGGGGGDLLRTTNLILMKILCKHLLLNKFLNVLPTCITSHKQMCFPVRHKNRLGETGVLILK